MYSDRRTYSSWEDDMEELENENGHHHHVKVSKVETANEENYIKNKLLPKSIITKQIIKIGNNFIQESNAFNSLVVQVKFH